jgi:hypothetical protein
LKFAGIILDTGVVFTIDGKFPSEAIDRMNKYYEFVGYTNNKLTERLNIFKRLTRSFQKKL